VGWLLLSLVCVGYIFMAGRRDWPGYSLRYVLVAGSWVVFTGLTGRTARCRDTITNKLPATIKTTHIRISMFFTFAE